jgi:hypothetical protein
MGVSELSFGEIYEDSMAAKLRPTETPAETDQSPSFRSAISPHAYLARLSALHDEAAETALLANLLGRAPWAAAAIATAALAYVFVSMSILPAASLLCWLALITAGVVAIGRAYGNAIEAPFDHVRLRNFARDLSAILLYLGFAWGAGFFLVLPAQAGLLASAGFVAAISAVLTGLLRARDVAFCFLAPATAMGVFAVAMRPLAGGLPAMLAILAGSLIVAGIAYLFEHTVFPRRAAV